MMMVLVVYGVLLIGTACHNPAWRRGTPTEKQKDRKTERRRYSPRVEGMKKDEDGGGSHGCGEYFPEVVMELMVMVTRNQLLWVMPYHPWS